MTPTTPLDPQFSWTTQPVAAALVRGQLRRFCQDHPGARRLGDRLLTDTGTRLIDWVDHFALPEAEGLGEPLAAAGFHPLDLVDGVVWRHQRGMFPDFVIRDAPARQLVLKVESVADFLFTHALADDTPIEGEPLAQLRRACVERVGDAELWVVQRHGYAGYEAPEIMPEETQAVLWHREALLRRRRKFADPQAGFDYAVELICDAKTDLGADWTCDLFFAAERAYWQSRNYAGRTQKLRQDALGMGWANHDHHTYRSSRAQFANLVGALEELGMQRRERFYAGHEAGWGAQVLEQPAARITVFADVDLSPDEVLADFSREPLPPRDRLGTVGLWCRLHGEAFLEAGLHHLECQFDFEAARDQLASGGVGALPPFTDFPYLRQAFTQGETWPVAEERLAALLAEGLITAEQADQFRSRGAIGSHLELLQRDDGFKGFNQTGISDIIRRTDPRMASV